MNTIPTAPKPMPIWQSVLYTAIPAGLAYIAMWFATPAIKDRFGQPFLVGYLICWFTTELLIFSAALLAFRLENPGTGWQGFKLRYRLARPGWGDIAWAMGTLVGMVIAYAALAFTAKWLATIPAFAPHPAFPPELRPGAEQSLVPGVFMGMPLKGEWWVLVIYLAGWLLNIFGEELWFRGFMLPRQESRHGRATWLVNGICFTLFHTMWKWNLMALFPGSLILSYVSQRRRSTWISIIAHGLLNLSTTLVVAAGVAGWSVA